MATDYKKTFTKPLPAGAELFTRKGVQLARWKPTKGKARTAAVITGQDVSRRVLVAHALLLVNRRPGGGAFPPVPTAGRTLRAPPGSNTLAFLPFAPKTSA